MKKIAQLRKKLNRLSTELASCYPGELSSEQQQRVVAAFSLLEKAQDELAALAADTDVAKTTYKQLALLPR